MSSNQGQVQITRSYCQNEALQIRRQDKNDHDSFERVATRLSINVGFQCNVYDYIQ